MLSRIVSRARHGAMNAQTVLVVVNSLLLVGMSIAIVGSLFSGYGWDIDHEIYFGQQLSRGVPIWTSEAHDKLPFVQEVFLVPGFTQSVQVWQALSVSIVCLAVAGARVVIPRLSEFQAIDQPTRNTLAWTCGLLFAFWVSILPGGISVINGPATSLWLLSVLVVFLWADTYDAKPNKSHGLMVTAAFFGAAAVSIRPYLAAPLAVMTLYGVFFRRNRCKDLSGCTIQGVLGTLAFLVALLLLNLVPYIVQGNVRAFIDGISWLAQDLNPTPAVSSIGAYVLSFRGVSGVSLWVAFGFSVFATTKSTRNRSHGYGASVALVIAVLALMLLILRSHWWSHYAIMFSGAIALLTTWVVCGLIPRSDWGKIRWGLGVRFVGALVAASLIAGVAFNGLALPVRQFAEATSRGGQMFAHPEADQVDVLRAHLAPGQSFLAPHSMFVHWTLEEPRHGFPHAANTDHILNGWWAGLPKASSFATPQDYAEYCDMLISIGPEVVAVPSVSPLRSCLQAESSPFTLNSSSSLMRGDRLLIFSRQA